MRVKVVGKREFTLKSSKYLAAAERSGEAFIITDRGRPALRVEPIRRSTLRELRGLLSGMECSGDINEPILPPFEDWVRD